MKKLIAVVLCLLMMVCSSCSKGPGNASGEKKTDITLANAAVIQDLDPANWYLSTQSTIFQNVYSTLVDQVFDSNGKLTARPNLAKSWDISDDGKTYTFHLNESAKYSNGDPVTADEVKTCFERNLSNPYTMSSVSMIDKIEVKDDHTIVFNLKEKNPGTPGCWYMIAIYNTKLYDQNKEAYMKAPVGSGPYELTEMDQTAGTYKLELKQDWWGDKKPAIQTVNICTITDQSSLVIALQKGEVNFSMMSGTNLSLVEKDDSLTMVENSLFAGKQLMMNPTSGKLSNKLVRQAIAFAINYDALNNATCAGYVSSKNTTIRFVAADYDVPSGIEKYSYDPDKAKQLLAEAGATTPYDVGTIYGGSDGSAAIVQQNLAEVGIKAEIVELEPNTMVQNYMKGDYDLGITSCVGYPDAAEAIKFNYESGQMYNFSHLSNADLDKLINTMMTTSDKDEYSKSVEEGLKIIVDECTSVSIGTPAYYSIGTKGLHFGPQYSVLDLIETYWE